jgi:hypothetical protein
MHSHSGSANYKPEAYMQHFSQKQFFRIFSANHRNQLELNLQVLASSASKSKTLSNFSSNAEKLRKLAPQTIKMSFPALMIIIRSSGLQILFPFFLHTLKFKFTFQVNMKSSDNVRCIRKYQKKDGSITYHSEVRRKNAKGSTFPTTKRVNILCPI